MGDSSEDESKKEYEETNKGAISKDLVRKCPSDPGKIVGSRMGIRTAVRNPLSGATRKCVLTLDGYSYVIGMILLIYIFLIR